MKVNENISTQGTIIRRETGDIYRVKLDNGQEIPCYTTSRFRVPSKWGKGGTRRPTIVVGDRVKVEIHPRDFSKGMLVGFVFR